MAAVVMNSRTGCVRVPSAGARIGVESTRSMRRCATAPRNGGGGVCTLGMTVINHVERARGCFQVLRRLRARTWCCARNPTSRDLGE